MNTLPEKSLKPLQDKDNEKRVTFTADDADKFHASQINQHAISENLKTVLETRQLLKQLKSADIIFSKPVLRQGENPIIYPHSINVIQGQAGVHKSRLAETMCSALLKKEGCSFELLNFQRVNSDRPYTVIYVDTERNLKEQFPYALQSILKKAGYDKNEDPPNFDYFSLLQIDRKQRFDTLNEFLNHFRKTNVQPLFIVLDVSTDCIEDFNKTDKSMQLIDLMNMAINEYDVIFLCLIHENPKSDKARGHFGTELMNKATTVMQVGFEKDASQNDSDLIRVKYLKCRSTAKFPPIYIKYSDKAKGLVLADASEISALINSRKHKAGIEDIAEAIELYLSDVCEIQRKDLIDKLCIDFEASARTIESRLKEMVDSKMEIPDSEGKPRCLVKETRDKILYYRLTPFVPD
ncbi:MAG TPA: hypothetical protein VG738_14910 [Chitinophagaceae bacterium]|nr:hypothetical protein [Chitinophagaceae bacterium]